MAHSDDAPIGGPPTSTIEASSHGHEDVIRRVDEGLGVVFERMHGVRELADGFGGSADRVQMEPGPRSQILALARVAPRPTRAVHMKLLSLAALFTLSLSLPALAGARQSDSRTLLIRNARIFDGVNEELIEGRDVLVTGNQITRIAAGIEAPKGAKVIDARKRVLMPGLIDAHWHTMFSFWPVSRVLSSDLGHLSIAAGLESKKTLLRGFTTVRDVGGYCFGVRSAIESQLIDGPRIYPSGPYISQTSGHGDFRGPLDVPANLDQPLDYVQRVGHTLIADGVPEVIKRTREALRMGATQIKAMAGGGVTSLYDPLDVTEYTFEEMKAICDVAATWNTYVAIHANTDTAIRMWIEAGAKSVEHGFFITDETARLMAERGVWWSMQPMSTGDDALVFESPISTKKYEECVSGLENAIAFTKKHGVRTAFGTDMLFDPEQASKQGTYLAKLQQWYTPFEALRMATHDNGQLVKSCGPRDPYPLGELGVVKEGAYADLLLVDGNPLEDLDLVADPEQNFVLIVKDGVVYKNSLP